MREGDNIYIYSDITCVFESDIPGTRLANKKDGASKEEVALEPASKLHSDERKDTEVVEAEVVEFIYDYKNAEYEETFESPPSDKRIGGIGREETGGDFNEVLDCFERHPLKVSENEE